MHDSARRPVRRLAARLAAPLALALLAAAPALGGEEDRPATAEEIARLRKALAPLGYTDLSELEVDCRIEVDARNKAGEPVALEVDLETLKILDEEPN